MDDWRARDAEAAQRLSRMRAATYLCARARGHQRWAEGQRPSRGDFLELKRFLDEEPGSPVERFREALDIQLTRDIPLVDLQDCY